MLLRFQLSSFVLSGPWLTAVPLWWRHATADYPYFGCKGHGFVDHFGPKDGTVNVPARVRKEPESIGAPQILLVPAASVLVRPNCVGGTAHPKLPTIMLNHVAGTHRSGTLRGLEGTLKLFRSWTNSLKQETWGTPMRTNYVRLPTLDPLRS